MLKTERFSERLWQDGHAIKVKDTNSIYCVCQSEQVAKNIMEYIKDAEEFRYRCEMQPFKS